MKIKVKHEKNGLKMQSDKMKRAVKQCTFSGKQNM